MPARTAPPAPVPDAHGPRSTRGRRRSSAAVVVPAPRPSRPAAGAPWPDGPVLTVDGRNRLQERAERLRGETLPELRPLLSEWQRDERAVAEFERAQAELDRLEGLLAEAGTLSGDPERFDGRVELGARVVVETPDGERTTVRLVHPEEAFLDDERVSMTSPLARALLGARIGHTVWVAAPAGPWPCRVVDVLPD